MPRRSPIDALPSRRDRDSRLGIRDRGTAKDLPTTTTRCSYDGDIHARTLGVEDT